MMPIAQAPRRERIVLRPGMWVVAAKGRVRKRTSKGPKKTTEFAKEEKEEPKGTQTLAKQFVEESQRARSSPAAASGAQDEDFTQRLAALKASKPEMEVKAQAAKRAAATKTGPLAMDGFLENKPAVVASTDDEVDNSRLPLQIGAFLSVVIFVFLYTQSDLQIATSGYRVKQSGDMGLSEDLKIEFEREAMKFEAMLALDPEDPAGVEGAAVSYAKLGEFKKAEDKLEQLVRMRPSDVEAIRLLAEIKAEEGDFKASADRYQQALAFTPDNLELLRGYTTILCKDKKESQAIDVLTEIRPRAEGRGNTGITGSADDPVDIVQLELLTGKVYGEWKGHSGDAVAVYNRLIENYKDDFRGYLAKGSILKEVGKTKDADRMFLQARYLAPEAAKVLVEQVASRPPANPVS